MEKIDTCEMYKPKLMQWIGIYWSFLWRMFITSLAVSAVAMFAVGICVFVIGIIIALLKLDLGLVFMMMIMWLTVLIVLILGFVVSFPIVIKWLLKARFNGFRVAMLDYSGNEFKEKLSRVESLSLGMSCFGKSMCVNFLIAVISMLLTFGVRNLSGFSSPIINAANILIAVVNFIVMYSFGCVLVAWVLKYRNKRYKLTLIKDNEAKSGYGWLCAFIVFVAISVAAPIITNAYILSEMADVFPNYSSTYGSNKNIQSKAYSRQIGTIDKQDAGK